MKLIIQIPCYNEAESLPETLVALPRQIDGIDSIEILVIDDGSKDNTSEVARRFGVHHIVRHRTNRGLAAAFQSGINKALAEGADIIVNTDADNQYEGRDIAKLVQPVLVGEADIVVGDRGVRNNAHFGTFKRLLQRLGSATVKRLSNTQITDAVSGFRAISRSAAQRINITSSFSYTTEMLIQAGRKRMAVVSVPIRTNSAVRPSRLFKSIPQFITNTGATMIRAYAMYNPLKVFVLAGTVIALIGAAPILRFLYYYAIGEGNGHIQSLVIGGSLIVLGVVAIMFGAVADLVGRNRQLLEQTLERLRHVEDQLRVDDKQDSSAAEPLRDGTHG
ncbi:Glycosyltransferase [hydrothermal vent metagenome]|uniref:Glycosyltransferase n=1 Tax=hydrothermal vent metagenome TaxID=652676 RepID=A0A3B0S141_9ZZZZ